MWCSVLHAHTQTHLQVCDNLYEFHLTNWHWLFHWPGDDDRRRRLPSAFSPLFLFFHSGGADLYKDNVRTCVCLCVLTLNLAEFLKIRTNKVQYSFVCLSIKLKVLSGTSTVCLSVSVHLCLCVCTLLNTWWLSQRFIDGWVLNELGC